ncbi:MAG TPA: DedA family protein [Candidatus Saccharimonadales bacterium]|nr:DedA family protein [Candidatus Saccharimonadales bacterium]
MSHILFELTHLPAVGIYGFLLFWLAAESVGVPLPDEAVLLTVGYLVHKGTVQLAPSIACATAGALIGASVSYTLGLRLGRPVVARLAARVGIKGERLASTEAWMRKRGGVGVFITRVLPIARNVASYAAGIADIRPRVFYPAMVSGSVVWCVTVVSVGDAVGSHYRDILRVGRNALLIAVALALLAVIGWVVWLQVDRRRKRRVVS